MKAVILAAGRGSRLGELTSKQPKCMVKLSGYPLIHWQERSLRRGGVDDLVVVTGYMGEIIEDLYANTIPNSDWAQTNMVASLLCAEKEFSNDFVLSYSDIVYPPELVKNLISASGDIVLAYDLDWYELWSRRFDDPLSDAESFIIDKNFRVIDIGKPVVDIFAVQGQYIGLIKFTPKAMRWIKDLLEELPEIRNTLDMTALLSMLIERGKTVKGLPFRGGWCEIDSQDDLYVAEQLIQEKKLNF